MKIKYYIVLLLPLLIGVAYLINSCYTHVRSQGRVLSFFQLQGMAASNISKSNFIIINSMRLDAVKGDLIYSISLNSSPSKYILKYGLTYNYNCEDFDRNDLDVHLADYSCSRVYGSYNRKTGEEEFKRHLIVIEVRNINNTLAFGVRPKDKRDLTDKEIEDSLKLLKLLVDQL